MPEFQTAIPCRESLVPLHRRRQSSASTGSFEMPPPTSLLQNCSSRPSREENAQNIPSDCFASLFEHRENLCIEDGRFEFEGRLRQVEGIEVRNHGGGIVWIWGYIEYVRPYVRYLDLNFLPSSST